MIAACGNSFFQYSISCAALCMVALNAIYPFAYAARRGDSVKPTPVQCPDCGECVTFQIQRLD